MYQAVVSVRLLSTTLLSSALLLACGGKGGSGTTQPQPQPQASTAAGPTGGDTFAAQKTGPIAPNCAGAVCAEVELASQLACRDTVSELDFSLTTQISGKTDQVSCYGDKNKSGALDLVVSFAPDGSASEDVAGSNSVGFRLRNYTGPGTYPLENLADDGDHTGVKIVGKTSGHHERTATVGTVSCIPKVCEAIVAEGSQPIPTDEMSTHEFRVRVEVRCPRGGQLGNQACEPGNTRCSFSATPTFLADVACRQ